MYFMALMTVTDKFEAYRNLIYAPVGNHYFEIDLKLCWQSDNIDQTDKTKQSKTTNRAVIGKYDRPKKFYEIILQ